MSSELAQVKHAHEQEEIIHLAIDESMPGDSVVPIRWCICKSAYDELKEKSIENIYILLVIVQGKEEVERKLVPLEQAMEYVSFQRPGSHKIFATIVWAERVDTKWLNKVLLLLSKSGYEYKFSVLDHERNNFNSSLDRVLHREGLARKGREMIEVVVDERFFAREPPKLLKTWVNYWYETSPRDQCQFRRRWFVPFTIQPPLMLGWIAIKSFFKLLKTAWICLGRFLLVVIMLLLGMRGIRFSPLIHPYKETVDDLEDKNSYFAFVTNKNREILCRGFFIPCVPVLVLLFLGVACGGTYVAMQGEMNIQWFAGILLLEFLIAYILVLGLNVLSYLVPRFAGSWEQRRNRKRAERCEKTVLVKERKYQAKEEEELRRRERFDHTFSPLVCTGDPIRAKLEALPKTHRTFYLRFWGLKRKVCKPYRR